MMGMMEDKDNNMMGMMDNNMMVKMEDKDNNMMVKMEDKDNNMMIKMEDKDNNMRTRGTAGRSLSDLPPCVYIHNAIELPQGCHATTARVRPFLGLIWANLGNNSTPAKSYLSYLSAY